MRIFVNCQLFSNNDYAGNIYKKIFFSNFSVPILWIVLGLHILTSEMLHTHFWFIGLLSLQGYDIPKMAAIHTFSFYRMIQPRMQVEVQTWQNMVM